MQPEQLAEAEQAQGSAPPPANPAAAAAAAAAGSESQATIEDLPDGLLGAVLARLGRHRASSLLLVSKRWLKAFMSEPALWRRFEQRFIGASSELALLRHVGSMVAVLDIGYCANPAEQQQQVLTFLEPSQLQQLTVYRPTTQLVAALPRFACLSSVDLTVQGAVPPTFSTALARLPLLCRLLISGTDMTAQQVEAVAASTQLIELSLRMGSFEEPGALLQLSSLRQLSGLKLKSMFQRENLRPPSPSHFPALKRFACKLGRILTANAPPLQPLLVAATALTGLKLSGQAADSIGAVLGQLPALRQLSLHGLEQFPMQGWEVLSALQSMNLTGSSLTAEQLGGVLPHLPLLEKLELSNTGLTELPQHLPQGLHTLCMTHNQLEGLPAGLASATRLTHLDVSSISHNRLVTTEAIDSLLSLLPHLRQLVVDSMFTPFELRRHISHLLSLRDD